jgi:rhodanese-related sulfurtransferase
MGNVYSSFSTCDFDNILNKINDSNNNIIISTLPDNLQKCLIKTTIPANIESNVINDLINNNKKKEIIIYGKNHRDLKVIDKYNQLKKLGFTNVYIYFGGLFEWMLLREIYGDTNFPIIGQCNDILIYK